MPESHHPTTYAEAGVHLDLGDAASRLLYNAARQTWEQRRGRFGEVIIPHDDFSGVRCMAVGALPADTVMGIGFDGIGTKIEIAERLGQWHTLAFDLFAMVCDDAVVQGAEPVLVGTVLDVRTLGSAAATHLESIAQLAQGYMAAAAAARVAVVNGELADPDLVLEDGADQAGLVDHERDPARPLEERPHHVERVGDLSARVRDHRVVERE